MAQACSGKGWKDALSNFMPNFQTKHGSTQIMIIADIDSPGHSIIGKMTWLFQEHSLNWNKRTQLCDSCCVLEFFGKNKQWY